MAGVSLWFHALGGVPWAVAGLGPHLWSLTVAVRRGPLGVGARRVYFSPRWSSPFESVLTNIAANLSSFFFLGHPVGTR